MLLFVALIFQIVSGLAISQVLAPWVHIKTINDAEWRFWHNQISTVTMFLVGFHLALSVNRIVSYFTKKARLLSVKKVKIKLNIKSSAFRMLLLFLLAGVVAVLSFLLLGKPSVKRLYTGNEIARFNPTFVHGIIQVLGETFLVLLTCFIARKWLKVRL